MALDATPAEKGLEGIIAAKTAISYIDGQHGRLFYQGIEINELAEHSTFEETIYLLWHGSLPTPEQLEELDGLLKAQRGIPAQLIDLMRTLPNDAGSPRQACGTPDSRHSDDRRGLGAHPQRQRCRRATPGSFARRELPQHALRRIAK